LQNEYNFINSPLPSGVTSVEDLFYNAHGFLPSKYQELVCECNNALAAESATWSPSYIWGVPASAYLTNIDMLVSNELACEECLNCAEIMAHKTIFDNASHYQYLSSPTVVPDYYVYFAN
jgi:hypothetical protein